MADLLGRERRCCAFFTFDLSRTPDGELAIDARVPAAGVEVLDEMARLTTR